MSGELSVKMSAWLAHVRAASEQGVTMAAYAAAQGLSASALYQAKSHLMKVGAWPRSSASRVQVRSSSRSKRSTPSSRFVPVSLVRDFEASRVTEGVSCRLSHVSGWTLTCDTVPPPQWLNSLLQGPAHAA